MQELVQAEPLAQLDYVSIATPETLDEMDLIQGHALVSLAVRIGETRLIDNVVLNNGGMATYPGGLPTAREVYGVSHMYGDYAKLDEGMGATGITVPTPAQIAPALKTTQ